MAKLEGQRQSSLSQLENQITADENKEPWYYYYIMHVSGLIALYTALFFLTLYWQGSKQKRRMLVLLDVSVSVLWVRKKINSLKQSIWLGVKKTHTFFFLNLIWFLSHLTWLKFSFHILKQQTSCFNIQ